MRVTKVVVGVDFTEPSLAAARWAATHFAPDAELVLVHVIPVPVGPRFLHAHLPEPLGAIVNVAPPMYGGLRRLATTLGEHRVTIEMRAGDPADQLAAVAEEGGADVICLGR